MSLYGMMCVKNEERWIERAIRSILPVCKRVYVLDDHSTDHTLDICRSLGCITLTSPFPEHERNEARDKSWLLERIESSEVLTYGQSSPDWVLYVDGDEVLVEVDRPKLSQLGTLDHWCVQILYLWDSELCVRWDGHYSGFYRPSLFRFLKPGMKYRNFSGPIHATGVPAVHVSTDRRLHEPEPIRFLHYGCLNREDRERKYRYYLGVDPVQEHFYRQECLGPAKVVPLESVLR